MLGREIAIQHYYISNRMKKLLLSFLLFNYIISSQAQVPLDSFFQKGAAFTATETVGAGMGTYWGAGYILLLDNDTIVNGKQYITVKDASRDSLNITGLLRVDGERVYYYKTGEINMYGPQGLCILHNTHLPDTTEILLYDFSLNVGDTAHWKVGYQNTTPKSIVLDIDSIQLSSGQYAKRYIFEKNSTGNPVDFWVRGPGSNVSLFGAYRYPGDLHANCYISGYDSYSFSGGNCFPLSVKENQRKVINDDIKIFPNPVVGNDVHVLLPSNVLYMQVTDMTGRVVTIENNVSQGEKIIHIESGAGMFIINIIALDGSSIIKRIQVL